MWKKYLIAIAISGVSALFYAPRALAQDLRAIQMNTVLVKYNSPMAGMEEVLIETAEKSLFK